jgi:hypothetical protein
MRNEGIMENFGQLIEGLQHAQELCDYHGYHTASMALTFALDYFGAEEEDVTDYIEWTNESTDPEWEDDERTSDE